MGRKAIEGRTYKQGYPQKLGRLEPPRFSLRQILKIPLKPELTLLADLQCWAYDPAPDHQTEDIMRNFVALSFVELLSAGCVAGMGVGGMSMGGGMPDSTP
jgi:hypothetical protein